MHICPLYFIAVPHSSVRSSWHCMVMAGMSFAVHHSAKSRTANDNIYTGLPSFGPGAVPLFMFCVKALDMYTFSHLL